MEPTCSIFFSQRGSGYGHRQSASGTVHSMSTCSLKFIVNSFVDKRADGAGWDRSGEDKTSRPAGPTKAAMRMSMFAALHHVCDLIGAWQNRPCTNVRGRSTLMIRKTCKARPVRKLTRLDEVGHEILPPRHRCINPPPLSPTLPLVTPLAPTALLLHLISLVEGKKVTHIRLLSCRHALNQDQQSIIAR
jgi:hypothetical protein